MECIQGLPDMKTEKSAYFFASMVNFAYEFLGIVLLAFAINLSEGNPVGIGACLWGIILTTSPMTGGHHNPSVSIGLLINQPCSLSMLI